MISFDDHNCYNRYQSLVFLAETYIEQKSSKKAEYGNDHAADNNQTMMLLNLTAMNDDEDKRIVPMKR